jgi:DegV family protein with EDD domain
MAVQVVTDSTADIPPELAQELRIHVVPLNVHFGEEAFADGVTLTADDFYSRLVASPRLPTTSQPSVGAFVDVYERLLEREDGIVSVHVSSLVSGTYNSATQALEEMGSGRPIEIVDSMQASLSLGLAAMAAARVARDGAGIAEVRAAAESASRRAQLLGLLETLEYLQKGGRIGKAQAWVGTLLRIKPLLTLRDGVAHPLERVRTHAKGVERLVEIARARAPLDDLAVIHGNTPDAAEELRGRVSDLLPGRSVVVGRFGPVMGTYLGPGSLGIALVAAE